MVSIYWVYFILPFPVSSLTLAYFYFFIFPLALVHDQFSSDNVNVQKTGKKMCFTWLRPIKTPSHVITPMKCKNTGKQKREKSSNNFNGPGN